MHATEEPRNGDPRAHMTMAVGIFGATLVVVIILLLQALFFSAEEKEQKTKSSGPPEELTRLRAGQLDRLNAYRWLDPSEKAAAVPIDRAMELLVRDQGRNPAMPAAAPPPVANPPGSGAGAAGR